MQSGFRTGLAATRTMLVAVLYLMWTACAALAAESDVPAEEKAAFEKSFGSNFGLRNLHEEPVAFLDGAKGRTMDRPMAQRIAPRFPPGMPNYDEYKYWEAACSMPLIAIATNLDSASFLTRDQKDVLTRDRFRIEQVVNAPAGIGPASIVSVARQGGEVVDGGERLRVVAFGSAGPYVPGLKYFLMGFQGDYLSGNLFKQMLPPTRIDGVIAYVEGYTDIDTVLPPAFEVQRVVEKFLAMPSKYPCWKPRAH